jgi:hypothetical protein
MDRVPPIVNAPPDRRPTPERSGLTRRKTVNDERYIITVEIDLDHLVDRFADDGEFVKRRPKQLLLQNAADSRNQDDEPGMQRLPRIEAPEVACVVGDERKIVGARIAQDIPIFRARPADMRDMVSFMAGLRGDGNQVDAEAFIDQKSRGSVIVASGRRERWTAGWSRQGCLRGRPRSG